MWRALLCTLLLGSVASCGLATVARLTVNDPLRPEDVAFIEPGATTLHGVVARLGAPDELTPLTDGAAITYHFRDARFSRLNFGWPLQFVMPVQPDLIVSGVGLAVDVFVVTFDRHWIARGTAFGSQARASTFNPFPLRGCPDPSVPPGDCRAGRGPL